MPTWHTTPDPRWAARQRVRVGLLVAVSVALVGCDRDAPVTHRIELADAVAEAARETDLGRLQDLAAGADEEPSLDAVMADLEPPTGVAEVRVPLDRVSGSRTDRPEAGLLLQVARPMAVVPDDGDPFCVVVGLASDGRGAATLAEGDVADDCREAVVPAQDERAHEGNPLDLWDQDPRWLDPRDPPP